VGLNSDSHGSSDFTIAAETSGICTIRDGSIVTYDVNTYDYKPIKCWATVAMNIKDKSSFLVRIRQNDKDSEFQAEVQVNNWNARADVQFTSHDAIVNGKPMPSNATKIVVKDSYGREILEVSRFSDHFECILIGNLTVKVTREYVEVTPQDGVRNVLRGLCGDFDGTPKYDLTGPRDCLYTDGDLFLWSWAYNDGQGCDSNDFKKHHNDVNDFQKTCPHRPNNTQYFDLNSVDEKSGYVCYQIVYPVKRVGPGWCASKIPVQVCTNECVSRERHFTLESAGCWPDRLVPKDVKDAERVGYLTHPTKEHAPFFSTIASYRDSKCVKK